MATPHKTYRWSTHLNVAYTGTPGTTDAVGTQTYAVRCVVTSPAHVAVVTSTASSATTSDPYVPANLPFDMMINPGERVSAIQTSASGVLHVTELT